MKRLLITGGTVFVSKFTAAWFQERGYAVSVLNRGTREQVQGVRLFRGDRHELGDLLRGQTFDWVIDVCGYTETDVQCLLDGLGDFGGFIFVSSSAVYPETNPLPFGETQPIGPNRIWGDYGRNKVKAEQYLQRRFPQAYILRPPYLYGPGQNVYREPFVFECAMAGRKFYLPGDGKMKLQFFHVEDLCRVMEAIMERRPTEHIFNVGNESLVDLNTFAALCYRAVGVPLTVAYVNTGENPRNYFSFYNYEYRLEVTRQKALLPVQKDLFTGLQESFAWYREHPQDVVRKNYLAYIRENFENGGK